MIKRNLIRFWDFLPKKLKPHAVLKFCFYGPESTGKSTMAAKMASLYNTEFVPEVAKEFIPSNNFSVNDIVNIGHEYVKRVKEKTRTANRILFCDTDLITTQIYSQQYLGVVPDVLRQLEKQVSYDLYFLFDIDVPWVPDGLRDLGNKRREMYAVFKEALDRRKINYVLINGDYEQREDDIKQIVNSYLE